MRYSKKIEMYLIVFIFSCAALLQSCTNFEKRTENQNVEMQIDQANKIINRASTASSFEERVAAIAEADQLVRETISNDNNKVSNSDWALVEKFDAKNTALIVDNIPLNGWFAISKFGNKTPRKAFLIIQHSSNLPIMKKVIKSMEMLPDDEYFKQDYALLYDRIAMMENRAQRYGSQLSCIKNKFTVYPIEDLANVDARRKSAGFKDNLEQYTKQFSNYGNSC